MGIRQGNRKRARELRRGLRRKRLALALMAAFAMPVAPALAQSLPEDGTVTYGVASIDTIGNTMTIHQTTQGAIIDWGTFNIATGNTVDFMQPDVFSVTLNRVNFNVPSLIDGTLTANGSVFLINSAGITFGSGAQVNVGGLIASTLDTDDEDFKSGLSSGGFKFDIWNGSYASIKNAGTITAQGVAFIGPELSNSGSINTGFDGDVLFLGANRAHLNWTPFGAGVSFSRIGSIGADPNISLEDGSSITAKNTWIVSQAGSLRARGNVSFFGTDASLWAHTVSIGGMCDGVFCGAGYVYSHTQNLYLRGSILQVLSGSVGAGPEEHSHIMLLGDAYGIATSMNFSEEVFTNTLKFDAGVEISAIPGATINTHATSFDIDDTAQILADTWKVYAPTWKIIHSGDTAYGAFLTDGLLSNTLDNGTSIGIYSEGVFSSFSSDGIDIKAGVTISHASGDLVSLNFVSKHSITGNDFSIESTSGALNLSFTAESQILWLERGVLRSNGGNIEMGGMKNIRLRLRDMQIDSRHLTSSLGGNIVVETNSETDGVELWGSKIYSGTGDVRLIGHTVGMGDGWGLPGVSIFSSAITTTTGSIYLEGHSVIGSGLNLSESTIKTDSGDIYVAGTSNGTMDLISGVYLTGGTVLDSGAGDIHIKGTASGDYGIRFGAGGASLTTTSGAISLISSGQNGLNMNLVQLHTDTGDIRLDGHAQIGDGVYLGSGGLITNGGDIEIVGTTAANGRNGVTLYLGGIASNGGDIHISGMTSAAIDPVSGIFGTGAFIFDSDINSSGGVINIEGIGPGGGGLLIIGNLISDGGDITLVGSGQISGLIGSGGVTTNGGDITLIGESADGNGILLNSDINSNGGAISINGLNTSASPLDNDDIGVLMDNSHISSNGGAIVVDGVGAVNGLSIFDSSIDAGSGSVELTGRGMTGFAMYLQDFDIATGGGNVSLNGVGAGPFGISWFGGGVNAGSGAVSLMGFGGGLDFHDVDLIGSTVSLMGSSAGPGSALFLDGDSSIQANGGLVVLQASNDGSADAIKLEGHISSNIGVVLAPYNVNDAILLGAGNGFSLTNAELAMIDSPLLVIGSAQQAGSIRVAEAVAWDGDLTLQNQGGSGDIDIEAALDVGDHTLALASGGHISQTSAGAITAHSLLAIAAGDVLLAAADNNVTANTLSGSAGGDFKYEDVDDLAIGNVSAQGYSVGAPSSPSSPGFPAGLISLSAVGITAAGNVVVGTASGDLTLGADVRGKSINLVAAETFQNSAAANLFASDGWRVWARTWEGEQRGGLAGDAAFDLYGCTYGQNCVGLAQGNQFVYQDIRETPITPVIDGADPDDDGGPLEQVHAGMVCPVGANAADPLGKGSNNDDLAREWSKTRHRIRLSGCIDSSNEGGCRF